MGDSIQDQNLCWMKGRVNGLLREKRMRRERKREGLGNPESQREGERVREWMEGKEEEVDQEMKQREEEGGGMILKLICPPFISGPWTEDNYFTIEGECDIRKKNQIEREENTNKADKWEMSAITISSHTHQTNKI